MPDHFSVLLGANSMTNFEKISDFVAESLTNKDVYDEDTLRSMFEEYDGSINKLLALRNRLQTDIHTLESKIQEHESFLDKYEERIERLLADFMEHTASLQVKSDFDRLEQELKQLPSINDIHTLKAQVNDRIIEVTDEIEMCAIQLDKRKHMLSLIASLAKEAVGYDLERVKADVGAAQMAEYDDEKRKEEPEMRMNMNMSESDPDDEEYVYESDESVLIFSDSNSTVRQMDSALFNSESGIEENGEEDIAEEMMEEDNSEEELEEDHVEEELEEENSEEENNPEQTEDIEEVLQTVDDIMDDPRLNDLLLEFNVADDMNEIGMMLIGEKEGIETVQKFFEFLLTEGIDNVCEDLDKYYAIYKDFLKIKEPVE
ncbi:hypothetical protein PCE1_003382 [Barthelona sp. PCE]